MAKMKLKAVPAETEAQRGEELNAEAVMFRQLVMTMGKATRALAHEKIRAVMKKLGDPGDFTHAGFFVGRLKNHPIRWGE